MSKELASVLRLGRSKKGYSLRQVEHETGISNAYLSQLEREIATQPSPAFLYKLSKCYDYAYEDLMRMAGYMKSGEAVATQNRTDPLREAQVALMSYGLNQNEVRQVTDFVEFVRNRNRAEG